MDRRLQLQSLLEELLGTDNVYFQPPPDMEIVYPCIVYQRDQADTRFAGNVPYRYIQRYQVTIIDKDADNVILEKVASLPLTKFQRFFTAENLNHDVFSLYF
jgi:hypothetical protein